MAKVAKWALDPTHSEIQFKVKHLMISTVTGQFNKFEGTLEHEGDDYSTSRVNVSIDAASIFTNNEQRDGHLRTNEFFDAETFPKITFVSEKFEPANSAVFKVYGTLTIKGVSKSVVLDGEWLGNAKDTWGQEKSGFSISGKVNRKDFGVNFDIVTEAGGVTLGDEVKFSANAQFVKQTNS